MSNNAEPWRKFAQTFFLAEQPNGYFVLNDIFRYLKEEAVDTEEMDGAGESVAAAESEPATTVQAQAPPVETAVETSIEEPVTTQPISVEDEVVEPKVNGILHVEPTVPEPESKPVKAATPEPPRSPTPLPEEEPAPVDELAPVVEEPVPTPTAPAPVSAPAPSQPPIAAAPPQPQAPPAPKTWANLAAANSNKWGNAVAQEAKGVSSAAAPSVSPLPSGATTPSKDGRTTPARGPKGDARSPAYAAAMAVTTPQCFVKVCSKFITRHVMLINYFRALSRQ